ncbi:MAG TPA: glycosyltransferase [Phycisphaerae bacterium]|nr:glycosyltransferase [Phycisphaerae bacterium]
MTRPAVSVIIAAYNCADLLPEAVASVRGQTYTDWELLIVDDGSTDDTWQVVESAVAGFPAGTARGIRAEHAGLAAARNRGVAEMRGRWIALLDADDVWLPQKLQRCMDFLAEHPELSIVYTPMDPVRLDGTAMAGHNKPCHAGRLTERLFHSIFVHDPAVVFHKRVIEACGGFDESLPVCVGHEFWLRVSTKFEFGLIDEPLAARRWSPTSLARGNRARSRKTKAAMLERFYFERGGQDLLSARPAMRRLAKVHYNAGKILLRRREWRDAVGYFAKALRYRPGYLKCYPLYLAARAAELLP